MKGEKGFDTRAATGYRLNILENIICSTLATWKALYNTVHMVYLFLAALSSCFASSWKNGQATQKGKKKAS